MIISNKKYIQTVGAFLMFLSMLILMAVILYFLFARQMNIIIIVILAVPLLCLILAFYKLRYTEIENSGFVLTVKKKHLLFDQGFVFPALELPVDLVRNFHIKDKTINLELFSTNGNSAKNHVLKIELKGFTLKQRQELVNSLHIKE